MTREQRDFLRRQIDARMRERLERARSARAEARTEALEAVAPADRGGLPDDVRVDVVTVGGERRGDDRRRKTPREARDEAREEARLRSRRRLQKVCDEGRQTLKPGLDLRAEHARHTV
jgi:hypothetical protein